MKSKLFVLLVILLSVSGCEQKQPSVKDVYPWQITLLPDGGSQVFGITFDATTLAVARGILGTRYTEGLFENGDGSLSLEVYFNEVTLGGISGKFILTLNADKTLLQSMKQRALKAKTMESGARRYVLSGPDQQQLDNMMIGGLSYIPYTNLDEEMIQQRFGMPGRIIQISEGKQHFLYPAKGLDLLLDEEGKELLQYVAPRNFQRLQAPLLRQYGS